MNKNLLLPRIKRKHNPKLEKFIISSINQEIENQSGHYDFIQMQYFLESVFEGRKRRKKMLKKIAILKNNGTPRDK